MTENDLIAAILTSGMLPALPPLECEHCCQGQLTANDQVTLTYAVNHAIAVYEALLMILNDHNERRARLDEFLQPSTQ